MKNPINLLFILLCFFLCYACKSKQKTISKDYNSSDYYSNLGSNISRLAEMRSGTFVIYEQDSTGQKPWLVNETDSLIIIGRKIGNVNKDGYWLCNYFFMSHAPDIPVAIALEHLQQGGSRDTIISTHFKGDNTVFTWNKISDPNYKFEEVDFSQFKKAHEQQFWVRQSLLEYKGKGSFLNAPKEIAHLGKWRQDVFVLNPTQTVVTINAHKTKDSDPISLSTKQVFLKLPRNNNFYNPNK